MLPLIIVRYLTQESVGHYRESFQVIANAVVILSLGVGMSSYYYLAREEERRASAILNILIFNFVIGGGACLFFNVYPQFLGNIFHSDELTRLAPKIGFVIWIWMVSTFIDTVAVANREVRLATLFIVVSQLSKTLLMAGAVFAFGSVEAFIYAAMIQGIIQTFILLIYVRSRFPWVWRSFDLRFFGEQLAYALPYGLAGVLLIAQTDIHNYFVGYKFSSADFAIYAYGCFEIPLMAMLTESVTSVLIPRMNALHMAGDTEEMIRLTARATQKLAFFYFPVYVFLLITASTFITTLFTEKFEASVPIFLVNITLLPLGILVNDPVIRSYKEMGRLFLIARVFILIALVAVLYFGLPYFGMMGMIAIAVSALVVERLVAQAMVVSKLKLGFGHLRLLGGVAKTAVASLAAGVVTFFVYSSIRVGLIALGERFAESELMITKASTLSFIGGCSVLAVSGMVFLTIYLFAANCLGLIDAGEKRAVTDVLRRLWPGRVPFLPEVPNRS